MQPGIGPGEAIGSDNAGQQGEPRRPNDALAHPQQENRGIDGCYSPAARDDAGEYADRQQHHQQATHEVRGDDQPAAFAPVHQGSAEQPEEQDGELLRPCGTADEHWVRCQRRHQQRTGGKRHTAAGEAESLGQPQATEVLLGGSAPHRSVVVRLRRTLPQ